MLMNLHAEEEDAREALILLQTHLTTSPSSFPSSFQHSIKETGPINLEHLCDTAQNIEDSLQNTQPIYSDLQREIINRITLDAFGCGATANITQDPVIMKILHDILVHFEEIMSSSNYDLARIKEKIGAYVRRKITDNTSHLLSYYVTEFASKTLQNMGHSFLQIDEHPDVQVYGEKRRAPKRLCLESAIALYYRYRNDEKFKLHEINMPTFLEKYPSFITCEETERENLLAFRNLLMIISDVIPPNLNFGHLLDIVSRLTEGHIASYITGRGERVGTKNRRLIYEYEFQKKRCKRNRHEDTGHVSDTVGIVASDVNIEATVNDEKIGEKASRSKGKPREKKSTFTVRKLKQREAGTNVQPKLQIKQLANRTKPTMGHKESIDFITVELVADVEGNGGVASAAGAGTGGIDDLLNAAWTEDNDHHRKDLRKSEATSTRQDVPKDLGYLNVESLECEKMD